MEALRNYESNDSVQNNPEKQQEAIRQETDRLFSVLEAPDITIDDLNSLVDKFASNNPIFQTERISFQDYNSSRLEDMLRANMTIEQCDIDDPIDYFGVRLEFEGLSNELDSIGLDLGTLLGDYKDSLENNLDGLDQESIEKVKLSIVNRLKQVSEIITDLRSEELDKYGNLDHFAENRWIINEKIGEHLSFINSELLPSLEAFIKLKGGTEMPEKFQNRFDTSAGATDGFVPQNINYINDDYHIGEVEELLQAHVDEEGNFDEGFFSTQRLFDMSNPKHAEMLSSLGINSHEVNLLNEKDKQIEQEAILYFMAMIGVQIGVETLGGVVGTVVGGGVDVYDAFSSEEELLNIAKSLGLAEKEFRMDKTWADNVLAGLGLIPGVTQIVKGSRLAKFMESVDPKAFEVAKQRIKEKLGIAESISKFSPEESKRLEMSENLLGRKLDFQEKNAIIEAHNYGERGIDGKYSIGDLRAKLQILQNNNLSPDEAKLLIREGICGNDIQKGAENLYNDERYSFLSPHKEILGENLTMNNILGEGVNGIVLRHPIEGTVVKIRKPGMDVDDIGIEIKNHEKVVQLVKKGKSEGILQDNIVIPRIIQSDPGYLKTYFVMEKIDGQTISTKIFRNEHPGLKTESPEFLDTLTDREIIELMIEKYGSSTESLKALRESNSEKYLAQGINKPGSPLNNTLQYLKENGIEHTDLHTGNIMTDKQGNIFIIDFGTMKNIK